MSPEILKGMPPWEWPESSDKVFLEILRDDQADPADRLIAAERGGASTVINGELAGVLLSIVHSGEASEDLRTKAALSLGPDLGQADMDLFSWPEDSPIIEETSRRIQEFCRKLYIDVQVPKEDLEHRCSVPGSVLGLLPRPPRHFGAFLHTLRWNCRTATDLNLFQDPFRAGTKIDAYQMEPLSKTIWLPRVRLFIADDTGLSKTIETALIARELLLRKKKSMAASTPPSSSGRVSWRTVSDSSSRSWAAPI